MGSQELSGFAQVGAGYGSHQYHAIALAIEDSDKSHLLDRVDFKAGRLEIQQIEAILDSHQIALKIRLVEKLTAATISSS